MRRIILIFSLVFFLNIIFTSKASAQSVTCTPTTDPPIVTTNEKKINLIITTSGLSSAKYWIVINGELVRDNVWNPWGGKEFTPQDNKIVINNLTESGFLTDNPGSNLLNFQEGTYNFKIQDATALGGQEYCRFIINIPKATSGGDCSIDFQNTKFTPDSDVTIKVNGFPEKEDKITPHRVILRRNGQDARGGNQHPSKEELMNGFNLGPHENGNYYVEIRDSYKPETWGTGEGIACFTEFRIPGGVSTLGGKEIEKVPLPCSDWVDVNNPNNHIPPNNIKEIVNPDPAKKCIKLNTALGEIGTDLPGFIKSIFSVILGLSGGVALILIIISGYGIMTSQGDPEKLKAAKERLTSAIIGLLFIIFSLFLLQVIGVDILRIPGFER